MRVAVVLIVLGLCWAADAMAQCPPLRVVPNVTVGVANSDHPVRNDLDSAALARLEGAEKLPGGARVLGSTARKDRLDMQLRVRQSRLSDGRYCLWAIGIDARIGDPDLQVYVASHYRPGSCEYRATLDHENTHVAIGRAVLAEYAPRLRRALLRAATARFPVISARPSDRRLVGERLMADARPVFEAMEAELRRRNAAIDTPRSYARVIGRCHGWTGPPPDRPR